MEAECSEIPASRAPTVRDRLFSAAGHWVLVLVAVLTE